MTDTKQFTLSKIDAERAVVTYLNLAAKFENREEITLKRFSSCWNKLFSKGDCRFSDDMKLKAYNEAKNILGELSIAEIQEYRNSVCIFEGTQVPKDILELAKTRTKDLKVRLAQNRDKNLSGFDLLIFYNCRDTMRLNNVPFVIIVVIHITQYHIWSNWMRYRMSFFILLKCVYLKFPFIDQQIIIFRIFFFERADKLFLIQFLCIYQLIK